MRRDPIKKALRSPGKMSRSAGRPTRGVLPRYVAIGDAKRVANRFDCGFWVPGMPTRQVYLDFNERGELIGVEIHGAGEKG